MKTKITEMLGIKYPVICGAMLHLGKPELAAAISNAGGLGNITAGNYDSADELRDAIRQTKELTSNPFGVNVTRLPSARITEELIDSWFRVCAEEEVAQVDVGGRPAGDFIPMLHKAGAKVFHKVGSVKHALNIQKQGYDAVCIAGFEEGGRPLSDDVTTMVLTPRAVDTLDIPVVTVGGISDGRGLAAALSLGAEGVVMGTRFLASTDASAVIHENFQKAIVETPETGTAIVNKVLNLQGRGLVNGCIRQVQEIEASIPVSEYGATPENLGKIIPLMAGKRSKEAYVTGDVDYCAFMIGQSVGLVYDIKPVQTILDNMVADAEKILRTQIARFEA
ncbi:nitronate monooxygenase [Actinomycetota bacterium]|nr:nitronate monooxygenase [Actinomycetota bacterium]